MNKEKQIQKQKIESEQLLDELSKMPPMVIATAYLHALNYTLYGADVTEKWLTATQNACELEKAYRKGYYDALQEQAERVSEQEPILDKIRAEIKSKIVKRPWLNFKDGERDRNDAFLEVLDIIDKYKSESDKESDNNDKQP